MVVATDNMDTFTRWTVPALGLYDMFDDILCSHEIGCLKKDMIGDRSRFFGPYLAKHDIGIGESVLIDDSKTLGKIIGRTGIHYRRIDCTHDLAEALRALRIHH